MDESYYVPDSYSIFKFGYEKRWMDSYQVDNFTKSMSDLFFVNNPTPLTNLWGASHPPFGKQLGSIGFFLFSEDNPLAWRFSALLAGLLVIVMVMLLAKYLFNTIVSYIAGTLVALDPMSIAMSRTMHLDIFLTLFVLIAIYFFAKYVKERNLKYALLFSVFFALASSIKWSGLFYYVFFAVVALILIFINKDFIKKWYYGLFSLFTYIIVYFITWIPWIFLYSMKERGNDFIGAIYHFINVHLELSKSHGSLSYLHNYRSSAIEWLIPSHSTMLQRDTYSDGTVSAIFSTPNIAIWILAIISLVALIIMAIRNVNVMNQVWVLILAVAAGWTPWLIVGDRTIFQFYSVVFQPYLYIIAAFIIYSIFSGKNMLLRTATMAWLLVGVMVGLIMYSSSVGLQVGYNLSGYSFNNQWQLFMEDVGLFDINQIPVESRKIYD